MGEIKLLGVGSGRVAQAPLAQELKRLFAAEAFGPGRKGDEFREDSRKFYVNYLKQVAQVFSAAWNGRKYSIKSAPALRAFIRVAPDVVRRLDQEHAERTDFGPSAASLRRGAGASATRGSRPKAPGSNRGQPWSLSRRNCGWRCSIPKERPSDRRGSQRRQSIRQKKRASPP